MNWTRGILAGVVAMAIAAGAYAEEEKEKTALDFTLKTIDGEQKNLADYKGKVVVVVNVASKCGLTPQYEGLQALYTKYEKDGLVVIGVPCNQFRGQEPGTEAEIKAFCTKNYGVTFPMFSKVDVNGENADPLYKYLTSQKVSDLTGPITWNFEKFVIGKDGKVVARFSPRTAPNDEKFVSVIETELKK
jgi:glutathione peroxidase